MIGQAGNLTILASSNVNGDVRVELTGMDVDTALPAILRSTGYVARRKGNALYVGNPEDFRGMEDVESLGNVRQSHRPTQQKSSRRIVPIDAR